MKIKSIIVCTLFISIIFSVEGNEEINTSTHGNITREKMIEIADAYANFEWYPTEENIAPRTLLYNIFHSIMYQLLQNFPLLVLLCALFGIKYVDTPDRDTYTEWPESVGWKADELNIGVPYQWGGFSSISGFNLTNPIDFYDQYTGSGTFEGKIHFAGDIFCDFQIISGKACGVDCSGFVSRCWNLSTKQSTRSLTEPEFSLPITIDNLQMGDLLIKPNYHVMLFDEFLDENNTIIQVYEAGPNCKVGRWSYEIVNVSEDKHFVELNSSVVYELYSYNVSNFV
jgi:hypothetical protein